MRIGVSIPLTSVGYERNFSAEIDVIAADELLVRGEMRDYRFAFTHTWRLRTPQYEVVEATAKQLAGEFDPELCVRYGAIKGVHLGRGFSTRIVAALGDTPGAREHLLMAIEMARVGQQIYQYTPTFEAQFPTGETKTEMAHVAWLKDRAYMTELSNSCYTYRDESAALFETRDVRCGFDAELTRPQPGDKRVFWRHKRLRIEAKGDAGFICESWMEDRIHDIKINFDVAADGLISNARSRGLRLPYHGICEDPHLRTAGLNGLRLTGTFVKQFAESIGGGSGCTHLFDLSVDVLRLFRFSV